MSQVLFGELLSRLVKLSGHDVSEILEDQTASRRRFGEIALSWHLCGPQHVWQAWCSQLTHETQHVDLLDVGVDAQALAYVPRDIALRFGVVPLRSFGRQLVLATVQETLARAAAELPALLKMEPRFVIVEPQQLSWALRNYYASPTVHAESD